MSSRAYRRCIKIYAFGSAHRCDPLDPHQQPITIVTTAHMQLMVSRSFFHLLSLQPQCLACGRKWRDLHGQRCRASGSKKREASNCARGRLGMWLRRRDESGGSGSTRAGGSGRRAIGNGRSGKAVKDGIGTQPHGGTRSLPPSSRQARRVPAGWKTKMRQP